LWGQEILKVLLINPAPNIIARAPSCPLGLLALASYLQVFGYCVKIVDQSVQAENIRKHIKDFDPDVVGVAIVSAQAFRSALAASKTAKAFGKPVVWGGQIISALPELGFKEDCVDYIVIGEGEITLHELLKAIESHGSLEQIDGLAFLQDGRVRINKPREFADLSTFPAIDWSFIDVKKYYQHFFGCKKMLYVYASKGCPAKCTFCFNPRYHRSTQRRRPMSVVVDEIECLITRYGVDSVNFADEFWYPGSDELRRFLGLIKEKKLDFVWGIQTRLGLFGPDELRQMYDAGCRWVLFGVESGCKERIKEINKAIDLDKAKETFDVCREIGITTQSAFIIGYPGETKEELKRTIRFALSLRANLCPFSILYLQPGSVLYANAVAEGKIRAPLSLREWSAIDMAEYNGYNISNVPDRDLKVVHFYTQWSAFADRRSINSDSFGIAKKMAADTARKIFRFGPRSFFAGVFTAIRQFLTVAWYAKAYPKIVEEYGLHQ